MAILKKEDFLNRIKEYVGEDTSDEAISFVQDVTETINDYESRGEDAAEVEKRWRKKYIDAFFTKEKGSEEEESEEEEEEDKKYTYDKLFKEG